ncbi:NAD(P)-dependent dehydrogenase (short-subunit alcohol dehydrogenase family) [Actinomadura coerulea]|uniref:NAD(P)-dependent dehydrogenase (Short-subunit alcohol dehydrogenase family) n=1 Tax=Actinomadura coerulea TaxID=46159 RepID=A0A7X0L194_9ACTN|nr:SDR family oxidoreductase [Actinomadura coerulea]MBB6398416.1 NAD(P)-dependent dehydrogenase (short-subunit alcohol dehydrogenase family) [Actinomadura coerulea]
MKTALITGASRGLGRALARTLARDGWNLVVDARDAAALSAVAAETGATAIPGDVADPAHRAALARAAGSGLDLLVNNASTLGPTPMPRLASLPAGALADTFATNVLAPLALIQAVLPGLRERRGAILNITSDAAVEGYETWGGYGASKAALEQLSNVLAAEEPDVAVWWADPGEMNTAMLRAAGEDADAAPPPEEAAAALHRLVSGRLPSGRYRAADLAAAP